MVAQCLCPKCYLNRKVIVTSLCMRALHHWRDHSFLRVRDSAGRGQDCKWEMARLATDRTLKPSGTVNNVSGIETTFVQFLRNHHIFIRSDQTTQRRLAFINRQGSIRLIWAMVHAQTHYSFSLSGCECYAFSRSFRQGQIRIRRFIRGARHLN